jgi:hydroxypyruvate reductase
MEPETKLRNDALCIFYAALRAANPMEAVLRHVRVEDGVMRAGGREYWLDRFRRILVVGAGKASSAMAVAVEQILGDRITSGFLNVKDGHTADLARIRQNECGHPVPDERGVEGAREIAGIVAGANEDDLVVCLVSGGASALAPFPARPLTLEMKQQTTQLLLASGANIHEMNAVRKHISSIKGGRLAALAYPGTVLALILSDVIGDDLDVIGSGMTAGDPTTFPDAMNVLRKYNLVEKVPAEVRARLEEGISGEIPETPKPDDPALQSAQNLIVGSNRLALDAAEAEARQLGYQAFVLSSFIEGETREVAKVHVAIAKEVLSSGRPVQPPACVISGGETTVTIRGNGKGGRNQEFVLSSAIELTGHDGVVVLSGGTDGTDGPTDAAGSICDGHTVARGRACGLQAREYLDRNDSYSFFDRLGDLVKTGPTNTNVMDVRLVLIDKRF